MTSRTTREAPARQRGHPDRRGGTAHSREDGASHHPAAARNRAERPSAPPSRTLAEGEPTFEDADLAPRR